MTDKKSNPGHVRVVEPVQLATNELLRVSENLQVQLKAIERQLQASAETATLVKSFEEVVKAANTIKEALRASEARAAAISAAVSRPAKDFERAVSGMEIAIKQVLEQATPSWTLAQEGAHFSIRPPRVQRILEIATVKQGDLDKVKDVLSRDYNLEISARSGPGEGATIAWAGRDGGPSVDQVVHSIEKLGLRISREGASA